MDEVGRLACPLVELEFLFFNVNVRSTIDIPDTLFREIKTNAVLRGETLKVFFLRAMKAELEVDRGASRTRVRLPIVKSKEDSYDLDPDRLASMLDEDTCGIVAEP
jgi:hypothetical protein